MSATRVVAVNLAVANALNRVCDFMLKAFTGHDPYCPGISAKTLQFFTLPKILRSFVNTNVPIQ
jgi:hypothetical protein